MRKMLIVFILFFYSGNFLCAQSLETDIARITGSLEEKGYSGYYEGSTNSTSAIEFRGGIFHRYNPVSLLFRGLMLSYQHVISPQISAECLYTTSCSNYAKLSIREFGLVSGIFMAADRLTRCNHQAGSEYPASRRNGIKIIDDPIRY